MDHNCIKGTSGTHLEFDSCRDGYNWWRCMDCGEMLMNYHDGGCGA